MIKNVLKILVKSVLIMLGLTASTLVLTPVSTIDATIQKNVFGMTALTISNKEIDDTMKLIQSL